jgi:hypothetical protein
MAKVYRQQRKMITHLIEVNKALIENNLLDKPGKKKI